MKKIPHELKKYYNSVEKLESINIWNIKKELISTSKVNGEWSEALITERKLLNYNLNKGQLYPNAQTTDIKGQINNIILSKSEIDYLKIRINNTSTPWLISRYAHIIWMENKHNSFAELAIDNYALAINEIMIEDDVREIPIFLSAILFISKKSKKRIDQAQKSAIFIINDVPVWFKSHILEVILDNNILTRNQLIEIANDIPNWIVSKKPISYFHNKTSINIGIKLFNVLRLPLNNLYEILAYNEDLILDQHKSDEDFIKSTTLGNKAKYFKQAGKLNEYNETLKEYDRVKYMVKMSKVSVKMEDENLEQFNELLKKKTEFMLTLSTEQILSFFAINEDILVDPIENMEQAKKNLNGSISNLFVTTVLDINNNSQTLDEDAKIARDYIQNYSIHHGIKCFSFFFKTMVEGIYSGKINYYSVISFLENYTWFGVKHERKITKNELDEQSTWITILAPGIHNLFSQFEMSVLMNTNRIDNYILTIDSLTIKFEGLLRDFVRLTGGNTSKSKRGELKEQLLEDLLENPVIMKYFSDKDIELFKFTFTKKGKNIRNNVAHSFYQFSDYNVQTALFVFFSILRLGKYATFEANNV